jgi:hypothetical protein
MPGSWLRDDEAVNAIKPDCITIDRCPKACGKERSDGRRLCCEAVQVASLSKTPSNKLTSTDLTEDS